MPKKAKLFSVKNLAKEASPILRSFLGASAPVLDRLLALAPLDRLYEEISEGKQPYSNTKEFLDILHARLSVTHDVTQEMLARVPEKGPLIVVANHPFGGIEACILYQVLSERREDCKFMANYLLGYIPEMRDMCIFVDPFAARGSTKRNLLPIRESIDWVQSGGVLCVFPSGTVSHFHPASREVTDPKWSPTVGRIIRKTGASVLPVFFPGRNAWTFQAAGLVHPLLRTVLLPRELYNKRGSQISLKFGNLIPTEKLARFESDEELIAYVRLRTYILDNQERAARAFASAQSFRKRLEQSKKKARVLEPIIEPISAELQKQDLAKLPQRQILIETADELVGYARAKQIPNILEEIGRLREITFRQVNEGTGRSTDIDEYDRYYTHLFLWNKKNQQLMGAYRLAKADQLMRRLGKRGLYTTTLFNYGMPLLQQLGPALELGRSFIRAEYQRNYTPLLLLWRGIAQYVLRNPRYKALFGPVSLNNEYDSVSRSLITMFLKANNFLPEMAKLIKARNPMQRTKVVGLDFDTTSFVVKDLKDVSDLLEDIEARQKSVPILLRQYLKLGGKLIGFNVDESFGDVLDGLIYVDLTETEPKLLERYLGKDGARSFLAFHGRDPSSIDAASA